jgi:hypothetical protein
MNHFGIKPKDLFEWGMDATIFPSKEIVEKEWTDLKQRILNEQVVYIRGFRKLV